MGLREIKRRASRHALIHKDSFSGTKNGATSSPGTPGEQISDSIEGRLLNLEHSLYDLSTRLARSEEQNLHLTHRCHTYLEGLTRCHQVKNSFTKCRSAPVSQLTWVSQWTVDLSQFVISLCPVDAPIIRESGLPHTLPHFTY